MCRLPSPLSWGPTLGPPSPTPLWRSCRQETGVSSEGRKHQPLPPPVGVDQVVLTTVNIRACFLSLDLFRNRHSGVWLGLGSHTYPLIKLSSLICRAGIIVSITAMLSKGVNTIIQINAYQGAWHTVRAA